jgi:hypothetical protein
MKTADFKRPHYRHALPLAFPASWRYARRDELAASDRRTRD